MEETKKSGSSYSILLGVAFVWFTTHFGGGFASGAQIYSYYVRYGSWCLIMPMGVVDNASNENNENTRRKATVVPIKIKYV